MNWRVENWYVFWGIGATIAILWLHTYARRHPETQFASHWERLHYAVVACVVFGAISIVLNGMLLGFFGIELFAINAMPWVSATLFVIAWFAAPYLRRFLPRKRGET
jgi:hypothetical protein